MERPAVTTGKTPAQVLKLMTVDVLGIMANVLKQAAPALATITWQRRSVIPAVIAIGMATNARTAAAVTVTGELAGAQKTPTTIVKTTSSVTQMVTAGEPLLLFRCSSSMYYRTVSQHNILCLSFLLF